MVTKDILRALRADVEAALAVVGEKHKAKLALGNCSFTSQTATFKLEVAFAGADGKIEDRAAIDFKAHCTLYGLAQTDLGRSFTNGGRRYKVTGLLPKKRKAPILCKREDGKEYVLPAETVKALLTVQG